VTEENDVANEQQVALRLPAEWLKRAAALVPKMTSDGTMQAWRVSRSAVLRVALQKGLEALEREYQADAAKAKHRP
jgi:hypothetical protein